ncbi:MAG: hypothetical protein ACJAU2_000730 [Maribacter sp.]|jgi:hypothetical protein
MAFSISSCFMVLEIGPKQQLSLKKLQLGISFFNSQALIRKFEVRRRIKRKT